MNNIIKLFFLSIILLFSISSSNIFAASGESIKAPTVREMQEDINELKKEKDLIEYKWNSLKVGNSSLGKLLKPNLSFQEKENLTTLVETYNDKRISREKALDKIILNNGTEAAQRESLLDLKKTFYKDLEPYISEENQGELRIFAGNEIKFNEQAKDVDSKIQKIENTKQQRVTELQGKIEDNNKIIRQNIKDAITFKVKNKLDAFVASEDFSVLPNEVKTEIFNKFITKLEYESIRLINLENSTSIIDEKILVFRVVIDLLKGYTSSWIS